jgi:anaerobic ribonucleoside-triphosphate reductase
MELKEKDRQRCEIWQRVMGYHRPISGWNVGKKQEFKDRKYFKEPKLEVIQWGT